MCVCAHPCLVLYSPVPEINDRPHKSGVVATLCFLLDTCYILGFLFFWRRGRRKKETVNIIIVMIAIIRAISELFLFS